MDCRQQWKSNATLTHTHTHNDKKNKEQVPNETENKKKASLTLPLPKKVIEKKNKTKNKKRKGKCKPGKNDTGHGVVFFVVVKEFVFFSACVWLGVCEMYNIRLFHVDLFLFFLNWASGWCSRTGREWKGRGFRYRKGAGLFPVEERESVCARPCVCV